MFHRKVAKSLQLFLISSVPLLVQAQPLSLYPAQGQTPEQFAKDRNDCNVSAVKVSQYDPTTGASTAAPSNQGSVGKETVRGGARGAAAGAAIGAIAGDAGKGAAIGAAAGGMKRGIGQRDKNQESQSSGSSTGEANYNQAFSSCMLGRGYSVQ